ncbi:hypothetical protein AAHA92_30732 [Salvia divinorum]|uniref:Secreted protein n=1 Tax=Salvia divinorum TaxID=28513 RepID=A0ABD1FRV0_SALDI
MKQAADIWLLLCRKRLICALWCLLAIKSQRPVGEACSLQLHMTISGYVHANERSLIFLLNSSSPIGARTEHLWGE